MNLDVLGNLGEFVGAIAVVVSVIYLALQIRRGSRLASISSHQASVTSSLDSFIIQDGEIARIFRTGLLTPESLNEVERMRFSYLLERLILHYEDQFEAFGEGLLDAATFEGWQAAAASYLRMPGGMVWWKENSQWWTPNVQERLGAAIRNATPANEAEPWAWSSE